MMKFFHALITLLLLCSLPVTAAEKTVAVRAISETGVGNIIGIIQFADSDEGLIIKPDLAELPPGKRGFHIHENPSCDSGQKDGKPVAGLAAGGHYDPATSQRHEGPHGSGHQGDLPALLVNQDGTAQTRMIARRLTLTDITNRAVIIHAGGDNYSDNPKPLGGGGARIACGITE